MINCNKDSTPFKVLKDKKVEAGFDEEKISCEGGILLTRETDEKLKLTEQEAKIIPDRRDQPKVIHSPLTLFQDEEDALEEEQPEETKEENYEIVCGNWKRLYMPPPNKPPAATDQTANSHPEAKSPGNC